MREKHWASSRTNRDPAVRSPCHSSRRSPWSNALLPVSLPKLLLPRSVNQSKQRSCWILSEAHWVQFRTFFFFGMIPSFSVITRGSIFNPDPLPRPENPTVGTSKWASSIRSLPEPRGTSYSSRIRKELYAVPRGTIGVVRYLTRSKLICIVDSKRYLWAHCMGHTEWWGLIRELGRAQFMSTALLVIWRCKRTWKRKFKEKRRRKRIAYSFYCHLNHYY